MPTNIFLKDQLEKCHDYTVYAHLTPSKKWYIGITSKNPKERWKNGKGYINNRHFYSAIKKYGWNNIYHHIVGTGLTKEQACYWEKELIKKYDTTNPLKGYNKSIGGEINKGYHLSEERKRKISEVQKGHISWNKGKHLSEEHKRKLSEAHKGKSHKQSEEAKMKISKSQKGNKHWLGKHHSEGTKRKISEAKKGKSTWNKGKHFSEDTKRKKSEKYGRNVLCIETNTIYYSARQAAIDLGLSRKNILRVCHGDRKTHGGYHWKYVD